MSDDSHQKPKLLDPVQLDNGRLQNIDSPKRIRLHALMQDLELLDVNNFPRQVDIICNVLRPCQDGARFRFEEIEHFLDGSSPSRIEGQSAKPLKETHKS
jgi:hypothetical protein